MNSSFIDYLNERGFAPVNLRSMNSRVNKYLLWLKQNDLSIHTAQYKHLLDYIGELRNQQCSPQQINRILTNIGHYYQYKQLPNIAKSTRVKGVVQTLPQNLLNNQQLQALFDCYDGEHKIILGLIIFQALDMKEFFRLKVKDLKLEIGHIYIPENGFKNSRTLSLQAFQILPLHQLTANKDEEDKLFEGSYNCWHYQFKRLSKQFKQVAEQLLDIRIDKLNQLRQSRVALWVNEHGIRKAQYMAGFRTIKAAERYRLASLEELKEQVKKYHPLQ